MQWDQNENMGHGEGFPSFTPAFMDQPPVEQSDGLFGARQGEGHGLENLFLGKLLQSVCRSNFIQKTMGITEEMDLLDPYHEQDDGRASLAAAELRQQVQQQRLQHMRQGAGKAFESVYHQGDS
jgi:hypothetical protein